MGRFTLGELYQLLIDLEEYLDQRADVNYEGTGPNQAMSLGLEVSRALEELKSGPILP
jgi:hypothetical protein